MSFARRILPVVLATAALAGQTQAAHAAYADTPVSTAIVTVPMVFPVLGATSFTDTFLACRSGCTRKHFGQDLMGPKMRPLVAAFNGVVSSVKRESYVGEGNYITIKGDNGWSANYLHVNNDTPGTDDGKGTASYAFAPGMRVGLRVIQGQLIGWSGDSGNAESTGPHLHFELRKGDAWSGTVYNAYSSLTHARHITAPRTGGPHPEGTFIHSCATTCPIYQIVGGKKRYLRREVAIERSIDTKTAVVVAPEEIAYWPTGADLPLPGGRAYKTADGKTWLVLNGVRVEVTDPVVLTTLAIPANRVRTTTDAGLSTVPLLKDALVLPETPVYEEALLKDAAGAYWYVRGGARHLVPDYYTLRSNGLRYEDAIATAQEVVDALPQGADLVVADGPVVKDGANRVYVVSQGKRRPFPSWAIYNNWGWKTAIVTAAPLADVNRLPVGTPLP